MRAEVCFIGRGDSDRECGDGDGDVSDEPLPKRLLSEVPWPLRGRRLGDAVIEPFYVGALVQ